MANQLSPELLEQLYGQQSNDPFLTLLTLTNPLFSETIYVVNNSENITSNGQEYTAFPFSLTLPIDDNETVRSVSITFDNTSLELINEFRTATQEIDVTMKMILASRPDEIQYEIGELKLKGIEYNNKTIRASLVMDDFLSVGLTSEKYTPTNYPGLF
jgi:hypothetical protein